ncbi:MAG: hypothetical protein MJZ90_06220 [Bacteroidales bacterium]|nr:hypothetical protein [Bacteroidales bacterium]
MATYTLTIDERTREGRNILLALRKSNSVTFKRERSELEISLQQVEDGNVRRAASVEDMMQQILGQ